MNIQFETSQIGQTEAQGLILLLSSLFPTATAGLVPNGLTLQPPPPKNEEEAIFGVPIQAEPAAPTAAHAQPEPTSESPKRTRRTKAEMEAAANANPNLKPLRRTLLPPPLSKLRRPASPPSLQLRPKALCLRMSCVACSTATSPSIPWKRRLAGSRLLAAIASPRPLLWSRGR